MWYPDIPDFEVNQMKFSDDDLKRLKVAISEPSEEEHPKIVLFQDTVIALLARLEAAERIATHIELNEERFYSDVLHAYLQSWRESRGL